MSDYCYYYFFPNMYFYNSYHLFCPSEYFSFCLRDFHSCKTNPRGTEGQVSIKENAIAPRGTNRHVSSKRPLGTLKPRLKIARVVKSQQGRGPRDSNSIGGGSTISRGEANTLSAMLISIVIWRALIP